MNRELFFSPDSQGHDSGNSSPEQSVNIHSAEHTPLDLDALMIENNEAEPGIQEWHHIYNSVGSYIVVGCADARNRIWLPPEYITDVAMIATAGPKEPYRPLFESSKNRGIIVMTHVDGDTIKPGEKPFGCGGQLAYTAVAHADIPLDQTSSVQFVKDEVFSDDAAQQAAKSAAEAARLTSGAVLAGVMDHVRGGFFPFAVFDDGGRTVRSEVPILDILDPVGHEHELYQDGIPRLANSQIPEAFKPFIYLQQEQVAQAKEQHPDYIEQQKIQRPRFVLVTTEKVPAQIRYPQTFGGPDVFFRVHLPRSKDEKGTHIDATDIALTVQQVHYPISHATKNHTDGTLQFSTLQGVIIETGDMHESERIADALRQNEWMTEFEDLPGHQLITSETRSGRTQAVREYPRIS